MAILWKSKLRTGSLAGFAMLLLPLIGVPACGGDDPVVPVTPTPWMVFASDRDGNFEIYMMNSDRSLKRLTNDPATDGHPAVSPNGRRIAFDSNRDGDWEIYLINSDGSGLVKLTDNTGTDVRPRWSPDGSKIVYRGPGTTGSADIHVMNADGTGDTPFGTTNTIGAQDPVYSHDGTRIAFDRSTGPNIFDVLVMDSSDGGNVVNVTNDPGADFQPHWSPGGGSIVFYSSRVGDREIYTVNPDGTGVTRLTNNPAQDFSPVWSPQGTRIAFYSDRDGNEELYVMNTDGTGITRVTNNAATDRHPGWVP